MKKRTAIAVAASTTLLSGVGVVGLAASGRVDILGFGRGTTSIERAGSSQPSAPSTVVMTQYIDDYVTVPGGAPAVEAPTTPVEATPVTAGAPPQSGALGTFGTFGVFGSMVTAGPDASANPPASGPPSSPAETPADGTPVTTNPPRTPSPPTTAPPAQGPGTTSPATPTTTWPPGTEISGDWHGPIPPIPPGCVKPHLEDNGVWNCEH